MKCRFLVRTSLMIGLAVGGLFHAATPVAAVLPRSPGFQPTDLSSITTNAAAVAYGPDGTLYIVEGCTVRLRTGSTSCIATAL